MFDYCINIKLVPYLNDVDLICDRKLIIKLILNDLCGVVRTRKGLNIILHNVTIYLF